jgi:hypothetical protein
MKTIKQWNEDSQEFQKPNILSDPTTYITITFPWQSSDGCIQFTYMGREFYSDLLKQVLDLSFQQNWNQNSALTKIFNYSHLDIPNTDSQVSNQIILYGNYGSGKSHILMALGADLHCTFSLMSDGKLRVVVIACCEDLVKSNYVNSFKKALLLAFANDKDTRLKIIRIQDSNGLVNFCNDLTFENIKLYFILDQADALDEISNQNQSSEVLKVIEKMCANHLIIKGVPANHENAKV